VIVAAGFMIIPLAAVAGVFQEAPPLVESAPTATVMNAQPAPVAALPAGEAR
jgi:hypothetical protein